MAKDAKDSKDKTTPQRTTSTNKQTRTEQRLQVRKTQDQRRRLVTYVIAGIVVAAIAALLYITSNTPADAPIPDGAVARYEGLEQTITEKGYPRIGSLDGIRVTVFTGFGCEGCQEFHKTVLPELLKRVESDEISLTYVPLRLGTTISNVNGAIRSALCAGKQGKFFAYVDALVSWIDSYDGSAFSDNRLTTGASNLGLNSGQFGSCRSSAPENLVYQNAAVDIGDRDTTITPPAVFVNDVPVPTTDLETAEETIAAINAAIDEAIDFRGGNSGDATPEPTDDANTPVPTSDATLESTEAATSAATDAATLAATDEPTLEPTDAPTDIPTVEPTVTGG